MTAAVLCMAAALLWATIPSEAATPSSGTLTLASGTLTYTAGPFFTPNVTSNIPGNTQPDCTEETPCDDYALTVDATGATQAFLDTHQIEVTISWPVAAADFDLYVLKGAAVLKDAATASNPEIAVFDPEPGVNSYTVRVAPFAPAGQSISATIRFIDKPVTPPPPPPASGIAPRFQTFLSPEGVGDDFGEPSIGSNWLSGNIMFYGGFSADALRVRFDDCASPANVTWTKTFLPLASTPRALGDPILYTDRETGRTLVGQLEGGTKQSTTDVTNDDGATYQPTAGAGINSGVDHQTIGGGHFAPGLPVSPSYQNAVYYCAQDVADANCALSLDGGITFGPAVPIYSLADCDGIHGHIKVAPDGTAYVPNNACGGIPIAREYQGLAVTEDNGITWEVRPIDGTSASGEDPSVAIASDGTLYVGYTDGDGHAKAVVSHDKGETWGTPVDIGAPYGIKHSVFPVAVAGDPDRAAVGFIGTPTVGNPDDVDTFKGIWHLYIATTYNGGVSWMTVDATPTDPVQVGAICRAGTTCLDGRNLLDFNDATVDKEGRVYIGYSDGCVAPACTAVTATKEPPYTTSRSSKAVITRQSGGRRMFAANDPNPAEPTKPAAPRVDSVTKDGSGVVHVAWSEPDNGGSEITGYNIYRREDVNPAVPYGAPLVSVGPDKTTYDDTTADPTKKYFYKVTAVNAEGEGTNCLEFPVIAGPTGTACIIPGLEKLTDPSGDTSAALGIVNTPAPPGSDLLSLQVAQPYVTDGVPKLVFTINTDLGQAQQPTGSAWYVAMQINGNPTYKAVHMAWNPSDPTTPVFESYTPGPNNTGGVDGRFVEPGTQKPAEASSSYLPPYNKVVIVVKASDLGLSPGDTISFVSGVSQSTDPGATVGAGATALFDQMPDSLVFTNTYTLVNNLTCRPNTAPTAALTATPASGVAPLKVQFSGSGSSDPDADAPADTIASYTFDFGDGSSPVTQSGPTISHTYTQSGNYFATLRVKDSRDKVSTNVASVVIEVQDIALSSFALAPVTVYGGCDQGSRGTVTLNAPAPSGGKVVMLSSSNTNLATVPTGVRVPAGSTSVTFPVRTKWVTSNQSVNITATLGTVNIAKPLALRPGNIGQLTLSPNPVTGGNSAVGTVSLQCRAPEGGVVVNLLSTNPAVAKLAVQSVTVAAGTKNKQFIIRTTSVTAQKTPTIKATMNGKSTAAVLKVNPQQ